MTGKTFDLRVTIPAAGNGTTVDDWSVDQVINDIIRNSESVIAAVELETSVTPPVEIEETRQEV